MCRLHMCRLLFDVDDTCEPIQSYVSDMMGSHVSCRLLLTKSERTMSLTYDCMQYLNDHNKRIAELETECRSAKFLAPKTDEVIAADKSRRSQVLRQQVFDLSICVRRQEGWVPPVLVVVVSVGVCVCLHICVCVIR